MGNFGLVNVDLDHFGFRVEARRLTMRDHIVKPCADEEHDVSLTERQITGTEEAAWMVLWHHPPPLWSSIEGDARLVDKLFEFDCGVRPQNTTARHNDWPLGTGQHI